MFEDLLLLHEHGILYKDIYKTNILLVHSEYDEESVDPVGIFVFANFAVYSIVYSLRAKKEISSRYNIGFYNATRNKNVSKWLNGLYSEFLVCMRTVNYAYYCNQRKKNYTIYYKFYIAIILF